MHCVPPLLFLTLMAGCGAGRPNTLGEEEYKGATSAAATTRTVANDPALKNTLPEHSRILAKSADLSDAALQVEKKREEAPLEVGDSLISPIELASDPKSAADDVAEKADAQMASIKKEQEEGFWSKLLGWSGWATVTAGALWLARMIGVPGVQYLTDPVVRAVGGKWIKPIEDREAELKDQIHNYAATVESSVVGRKALQALDGMIGDSAAEQIRRLTGGQASTIEGLFKWTAQTHARDHVEYDSNAIADIVDQVKDRLPTDGDIPGLVNSLLSRALG